MKQILSIEEIGKILRNKYQGPLVAVDVLIEYASGVDAGLVLIERVYPPYGIALPGGFVDKGETLEEAAARETHEETGLVAEILTPERPFYVFSSPTRDPREHIMTAVYIARGTGTIKAGDDAKSAKYYDFNYLRKNIKSMQFALADHKRAVERYLKEESDKFLPVKQ